MHSRRIFLPLTVVVVIGASVYALPFRVRSEGTATPGKPQSTTCPNPRRIVDIKAVTDPRAKDQQRHVLIRELGVDDTTVRLGPDVDVDFSGVQLPIKFGRCVTLTSVSAFLDVPPTDDLVEKVTEARTPKSPGPVLRFGKHLVNAKSFIEIRCYEPGAKNDGARISGFRLYGPDFGQQETSEIGISIDRCVDIAISNMEIAGWGSSAIAIHDDPGPDRPPGTSGPGGRISNPDQIVIRDNFIHHNQHRSKGGTALGYGVSVGPGAWAAIIRNAFDFNRHSITADGTTGGYLAKQNLVLKGGGFHGSNFNTFTHSFDVHGTGCRWSSDLCGDAGIQFWYIGNAFQFRKENAIKIRGKPAHNAYFTENIFPHPGLEDDEGDDAIHLNTTTNVTIGAGNEVGFDSFGKYGVCDFDGDNIDDLFLATGSNWWYSSSGKFPWSYLTDKKERPDQLRLGYFDSDLRCDVVTEKNGLWAISSGGSGDWRTLGQFDAPISEVYFGRFDPAQRDTRPGATRQTTHAFWRRQNGEWWVTPLSGKDWKLVQNSSVPMNQLKFGDFNGDGVTDVLAVRQGRWAISESASTQWQRLNNNLGGAVADLFIANMDANDNIDDILRLIVKTTPLPFKKMRVRLAWWRSKNGVERWRLWKVYTYEYTPLSDVVAGPGFVGRFGAAPGGATLAIDANRLGHFFNKSELATDVSWTSQFSY